MIHLRWLWKIWFISSTSYVGSIPYPATVVIRESLPKNEIILTIAWDPGWILHKIRESLSTYQVCLFGDKPKSYPNNLGLFDLTWLFSAWEWNLEPFSRKSSFLIHQDFMSNPSIHVSQELKRRERLNSSLWEQRVRLERWGFLGSTFFCLGVSKNRGTPKWMVYNGKPY